MSQVMGMFTQLVSSFVGAGNAEGIEQLAAVIERGQEGVAAAEEEWDEEEFHDADDGAAQMRESAANAIVCAWRRFRWRREWRRARAAKVIAAAWKSYLVRGSKVLFERSAQGSFARCLKQFVVKAAAVEALERGEERELVQEHAQREADLREWEEELNRDTEVLRGMEQRLFAQQRRIFATRGVIERMPGVKSLVCDGCEALIPARTTVVSVVGSDVDFCVECIKHWPLGMDGTLEMRHTGPPHDDFPIKVDQPEGVAVLLSVLKEVPRMAQKRGLLAQPLPAEVEATDIGPPGSTTSTEVSPRPAGSPQSGGQPHSSPQPGGSVHGSPRTGSQGGPQPGDQAKAKKKAKKARQKAERRAATSSPSISLSRPAS